MFSLYIAHCEHQPRAAKNNVVLVDRDCFLSKISCETEGVALPGDVVGRTNHQHDSAFCFPSAIVQKQKVAGSFCGSLYHQIYPAMTSDCTTTPFRQVAGVFEGDEIVSVNGEPAASWDPKKIDSRCHGSSVWKKNTQEPLPNLVFRVDLR